MDSPTKCVLFSLLCVVPMLLLAWVKMAAGSISLDEFHDLALKFVDFSSKINDDWIVKNPSGNSHDIYLAKSAIVRNGRVKASTATSEMEGQADLDIDDIVEEEADPSCLHLSAACSEDYLSCQYHVVYSHSYSVPVLYFNICKPDGKRLSLEEVWSRVPAVYQQRIDHHKWATLTQQEHPHLGCPFFMLHPCHTASLMSQVPAALDRRIPNTQPDFLSFEK